MRTPEENVGRVQTPAYIFDEAAFAERTRACRRILGEEIGLCFSMLIELLQLVLKRGLTEIDDVVHNGVGCVIGYWAFVGCRKMAASCFGGIEKSCCHH